MAAWIRRHVPQALERTKPLLVLTPKIDFGEGGRCPHSPPSSCKPVCCIWSTNSPFCATPPSPSAHRPPKTGHLTRFLVVPGAVVGGERVPARGSVWRKAPRRSRVAREPSRGNGLHVRRALGCWHHWGRLSRGVLWRPARQHGSVSGRSGIGQRVRRQRTVAM